MQINTRAHIVDYICTWQQPHLRFYTQSTMYYLLTCILDAAAVGLIYISSLMMYFQRQSFH